MCVKFEGDWILHLCFKAVFPSVWKEEINKKKRKIKNKENKQGSYLRNGWTICASAGYYI